MRGLAQEPGALVFLDAFHHPPPALIAVAAWGCDFLVCSAYKFFGPHVGVLWGRRELLEELPAYKVRPAAESLPDRWMTGTPNFEGIAGAAAAIDYLVNLGRNTARLLRRKPRTADSRRHYLIHAFVEIVEYERELCARLLSGLAELKQVKVWGITDAERLHERVPTVSFTHKKLSPKEITSQLGERGIFAWHGNFYALPLTEALGLEPDGMVRVGLLHYNTTAEVDRLLTALREWE